MAKLVWRVKLVFEAEPGVLSETEVAPIERDELAVPEPLGLMLHEAKQITAAMQRRVRGPRASATGHTADCGNCSCE